MYFLCSLQNNKKGQNVHKYIHCSTAISSVLMLAPLTYLKKMQVNAIHFTIIFIGNIHRLEVTSHLHLILTKNVHCFILVKL